jgi:glucose-6-phosphate dehydrogenase assembly protein OpcA
VSSSPSDLLPTGADVPFTDIGDAIARGACQDRGGAPMRALVATVVAVGPINRLGAAAEALQALGDAGTVRGILISDGSNPAPPARVAGNIVALHGIKAPYVNNAVAALRLSSLPTLVWWRGGRPETLDGLAGLADRIVLDDIEPEPIWARAVTLFAASAFSDLRWARLTQWRALMAHFFDIPEVQAAASDFTRLTLIASDRVSARLFAAWLESSIRFRDGFDVEYVDGPRDTPIDEVRLGDREQELVIRTAAQRSCLETSVSVRGHRSASRLVSLTDQTLTGLISEELRIRARDTAFEKALGQLVADRTPTG